MADSLPLTVTTQESARKPIQEILYFRVSNFVHLFGDITITTAPSDYFLLLKEQDGTLQSNEANTGVFVKTRSLQKLQRKMTVLYEKQKEKGALVQNNFSS